MRIELNWIVEDGVTEWWSKVDCYLLKCMDDAEECIKRINAL